MILGPFYTYCPIHSPVKMRRFCDICLSACLSHTSPHYTPFVHSVIGTPLFYGEITSCALVNDEVILRSKSQRSSHWSRIRGEGRH